ncbi:MAG: hypothetical protein M0R03_16710 [Novosphingobium sp.]|nr:hypothetical protein [Novosphingobium sp.]
MSYNRHTMGQDWGGRYRLNPPGATKVTKQEVIKYAEENGLKALRDNGNFSMWWLLKSDGSKG